MPESDAAETGAAETRTGETCAGETADERVIRAVRDVVGQGARVQISGAATPRICLVLMEQGSTRDLFALRRDLTQCLSQAPTLYTLFLYGHDEAGGLHTRFPGEAWRAYLDDPCRTALIELYRQGGHYPSEFRQTVIHSVRRNRNLLDHLQGTIDVPLHLWLSLVESTLRDAWTTIFAINGQRFVDRYSDSDDVISAALKGSEFDRRDLLDYFALQDLVAQARQYFLLTGRDLRACADREVVHDSALRVFDLLERRCQSELVTEAERRRRRTLRLAVGIAAGVVLLLGSVAVFVSTRPLQPLNDTSRIVRPGGLGVTLYRDTKMANKAGERVMAQPFFSTMGSPAPGVGHDHWSARFEGYLYFPEAGRTVLCVENDDGAKLYLNGEMVISDWNGGAKRRNCKPIRVKRGWYPLKIEYFDDTGAAFLRVLRGPQPSRVTQIPAAHYCCGVPTKTSSVRRQRTPVVPTTLVQSVGGHGGMRDHEAHCDRFSAIGSLLVGTHGKQQLFSALRPVCQRTHRTGAALSLTFPVRQGPMFGRFMERRRSLRCPNGRVPTGIFGYHQNFITQLGLLCGDPLSKTAVVPTRTDAVGLSQGTRFSISCPQGSVLHGLQGRSGDLIDKIGVSCVALRSLTVRAPHPGYRPGQRRHKILAPIKP